MQKNKQFAPDTVQEIELKDILLTRQWLYDFLGKSFYTSPDIHKLKNTSEIGFFQKLLNIEENCEDICLLSDFISNITNISEEEIDNLNFEYNRLFIGPGHLPAPPWESVYRSREKIILDEHTLAVRKFYKKWQIVTQNKNKDPDDHIGFELEFISILIGKSIKALEDSNMEYLYSTLQGQRDFLISHLLIWVDEFSKKLAGGTEHPFYKGLALFTPKYLKMDKELLDDIVSNLKVAIEK